MMCVGCGDVVGRGGGRIRFFGVYFSGFPSGVSYEVEWYLRVVRAWVIVFSSSARKVGLQILKALRNRPRIMPVFILVSRSEWKLIRSALSVGFR